MKDDPKFTYDETVQVMLHVFCFKQAHSSTCLQYYILLHQSSNGKNTYILLLIMVSSSLAFLLHTELLMQLSNVAMP